MTSMRSRVTVALSLAAGAALYASDHDTIDRHWRIALGLTLGAVLVSVAPLGTAARALWARLRAATRTNAGSSDGLLVTPVRSRRDSPGRPARILVVAVGVLIGSGCGTSRSVRAGDPEPAPAPVRTFASLPGAATSDHALLMRAPLAAASAQP